MGVALLLLMTGIASAQSATPAADTASMPQAPQATATVQNGFVLHESADLGGHYAKVVGSGSMYDTLVNIQSGPRVFGETFTLHAVPGSKHSLLDSLSAFSSGFGGDPNNFAKLDVSKGKLYEFTGTFRRDRQYFDYDLLGNPMISSGLYLPYGETNGVLSTSGVPYKQLEDSPVMFNTVRRMTDTNLTLLPLSKVTFRIGYSQNIFQGPSMTPGESVGKYNALLEEYQRNSSDDFRGGVDWKPLRQTKFTFEEEIEHYKINSYFTLAPQDFIAQEANGEPVALGDWDVAQQLTLAAAGTNTAVTGTNTAPAGIAECNTASMGSGYTNATNFTIFTPAQTPGGLPIINAACDVTTSYVRNQSTREIFPTEMFRFQSSSIKNIAMNGDFSYTGASVNLPNYYENWQGLDGALRSQVWAGSATVKRRVVGAHFGITYEATKKISVSDQVSFSSSHQPGTSVMGTPTLPNGQSLSVPTTGGNENINYTGALTPGTTGGAEGSSSGYPILGYFGQLYLTNNATISWDATERSTFSLTWRYRTHDINDWHCSLSATVTNCSMAGSSYYDGSIVNPYPTSVEATANAASSADTGTINIVENGAIFNAALRPTDHLTLNGTVEVAYDNQAFTPVAPRQTKIYRVHSIYRPKTWATVSASYIDTEHHNNTYDNNFVTTTGAPSPSLDGTIDHVDYSRKGSMTLDLAPSQHFAFDFTYGYSDVYTSTNICFDALAATSTLPSAVAVTSSGGPSPCPSTSTDWGVVKDFADAPTQYASGSITLIPVKAIEANIGYNISAVSGNQLFENAQMVNGSMQSAYQSPFVHLAYTIHPGWVWKADYNYYGYGEGGPSGAPYCTNTQSTAAATAVVAPCNSSSITGPTGLTEPSSGLTAPRNFHANLLTLSMHYEF
ncbi:MAG: hypothetical protein WBY53_15835 [Acidobacteriaceae bacterium]